MDFCYCYCGTACVNGLCPKILYNSFKCIDCWLYNGCEDCAFYNNNIYCPKCSNKNN